MFRRSDEREAARPPKKGLDTGPGLTKQSMSKECDINLIMDKYKKTGTVNFLNSQEAIYTDDMVDIDFHEAMTVIADANNMFAQMPAHLRKEFKNDPGNFLEAVHDPEQAQRMFDLGLSSKNPSPATEAVTAAPAAPAETPENSGSGQSPS